MTVMTIIFIYKIPARMELYLSISVEGTSPFDFIRVYNNSGNEIGSVYSGWSYNRSSNRCYIKIKMNLNGGSYYIRQADIYRSNSEKHRYSVRLTGQFANAVSFSGLRKAYSGAAKLTWRRFSGVDGYEIFLLPVALTDELQPSEEELLPAQTADSEETPDTTTESVATKT